MEQDYTAHMPARTALALPLLCALGLHNRLRVIRRKTVEEGQRDWLALQACDRCWAYRYGIIVDGRFRSHRRWEPGPPF